MIQKFVKKIFGTRSNKEIKKLYPLVEKINQFDSYVTYSYLDHSYDLLLHNSLKNKSISEIDSILNFLKSQRLIIYLNS